MRRPIYSKTNENVNEMRTCPFCGHLFKIYKKRINIYCSQEHYLKHTGRYTESSHKIVHTDWKLYWRYILHEYRPNEEELEIINECEKQRHDPVYSNKKGRTDIESFCYNLRNYNPKTK